MNTTSNGRWGRYKLVGGVEHKLCNGPLHPDGEWMPLRSFWVHKTGVRAGKPMSQCAACERVKRGRFVNSGLVPVDKVYFIFNEIESRIGRAEACRRLGVSQNLWMRLDKRIYKRMEKQTVAKAMTLLKELRANGEVRHKKSIRHGAKARGREERRPRKPTDYYKKVVASEEDDLL